jgi:hypothetical protein
MTFRPIKATGDVSGPEKVYQARSFNFSKEQDDWSDIFDICHFDRPGSKAERDQMTNEKSQTIYDR